MVLDTSLLNTQHYKARIKGKVEQSRERSSTLPYTSLQKLLKKEPSGRPWLRSPILLYFLNDSEDGLTKNRNEYWHVIKYKQYIC